MISESETVFPNLDSRVDPRFKTDTKVTVQFSRKKTRQVPASIVDVSALGFRMLVKEALANGELLQINNGDRHVLVMVRHCVPVENGYSVGVERIDEWRPGDKATSSENPGQNATSVLGRPQLKEHLGELRIFALRNLFSGKSSAKGISGLVLGGIVAAIGLCVLSVFWDRIPGNGPANALPSAPARQAERTQETGITKRTVANKATNSVVPPAVAASEPQPTVSLGSTALSLPDRRFSGGAAMSTSFAQVTIKPPATAQVPAPSGPLQVTLHASDQSWVDACADGKLIFSKALNAGETGQIRFSKVATIRSGNAGALEITFGSRPAERMSEKGFIHMWKFTPEGLQEVPSNSESACTVH